MFRADIDSKLLLVISPGRNGNQEVVFQNTSLMKCEPLGVLELSKLVLLVQDTRLYLGPNEIGQKSSFCPIGVRLAWQAARNLSILKFLLNTLNV